ncbi:hypothetical protein [Microvirga sp. VF16]|uniref:hypothetical protein n=1 Tax=Microvirga sp. VF16 TaxID=2807101 RepID=UPI00193D8A07|nr:hypothetical protein [Microvirga sp. VF16]QRM33466.1 hypothetical protein JO965_36085 [Microvirga sp. VF16]
MYQISRICVSNCGHRDAVFKNNLISFLTFESNKVASSVMLHAPNGNGKTTILSFILHLFVPAKPWFVQTRQKSSHKFADYVAEKKPTIFVMELCTKERGLIDADRPALVIGVVATKSPDGASEETFFMIRPSGDYGFDDLPFVQLAKQGKELDWSNSDAFTWFRELRNSAVSARVTSTQKEWQELLRGNGLSLASFETQIDMASSEGGIEKFLEASNPTEMMERLLSVIIDESQATDTIGRINEYLEKIRDLPKERAIAANTGKLITVETTFAGAYREVIGIRKGLVDKQGQAKGALETAATRIAVMEADQQRADEQIEELKASDRSLRRDLEDAKVEWEAVRVHGKRKMVRKVEENLEGAKTRFAEVGFRIEALKAAPSQAKALQLNHQFVTATEEVYRLEQGEREKLVPLRTAGSNLKARIGMEVEQLDASIGQQDESITGLAFSIKEADATLGRLGRELASLEASLAEHGRKKTEIAGRLAKIAADGILPDAPADLDALRDGLKGLEGEEERLREEERNLHMKKSELTAELRELVSRESALSRELADAKRQSDIAREKLKGFIDQSNAIKRDYLEGLYPGADANPSDPDLAIKIDDEITHLSRKLDDLRDRLSALRDRIRLAEEGGSFDDDDVARAMELCRKAGVTDISTYVHWVSENVTSQEAAKNFVECNLDITLGLRVHNKADLQKIRKAFNRETWGLRKPVAVSVVRDIDSLKDELIHDQIVLSARNDYAYHEPTRREHLEKMRAEEDRLKDDISKLDERETLLRGARNAISAFSKKFGAETADTLTEAAEYAVSRVEGVVVALEEAREGHASKSAQLLEKGELIERCDACVTELVHRLKRLRNDEAAVASRTEELAAIDFVGKSRRADEVRSGIDHCERTKLSFEEAHRQHLENRARLNSEKVSLQNRLRKVDFEMEGHGVTTDLTRSVDTYQAEFDRLRDDYRITQSADSELAQARARRSALKESVDSAMDGLNRIYKPVPDQERSRFIQLVEELALPPEAEREADLAQSGLTHAGLQKEIEEHRQSIGALKAEGSIQIDADLLPRVEVRLADPDFEGDTTGGLLSELTKSIDTIERTIRLNGISIGTLQRDLSQIVNRLNIARPIHARLDQMLKGTEVVASYVELPPSPEQWNDVILGIVRDTEELTDRLKAAELKARKYHDEIVSLAANQNFPLGSDDGLRMRFGRFNGFSEHGDCSEEILDALTQKLKGHHSIIDTLTREEDLIVDNLSSILEDTVEIIGRAIRKTIPEFGGVFSGRTIVKLPTNIDFKALKAMGTKDVSREYLQQLMASDGTHRINSLRVMSTEMLNIMSKRLNGQPFELLLLKPVVQSARSTYERMHTLTGSGGQTITAGLLLNMLASSLRNRNGDQDASSGFIILDNPIGKANQKSLVDTQLQVAKAFGIQLISASGITDKCINSYEWIVTFSANRQTGAGNHVSVDYEENKIHNFHIALKLEDSVAA